MRTFQFAERHPPGDGPWRDEPDKAQWVDEKTGLDCLIVRGPFGALCGYVGLPPEHPWHGAGHKMKLLAKVRVHGGLTFASYCQEGAEDGPGVCHVPEPGRPEHPWWIGFDCCHPYDHQPGLHSVLALVGIQTALAKMQTYRTFHYVQVQVTRLAAQAAAAKPRRGAATPRVDCR